MIDVNWVYVIYSCDCYYCLLFVCYVDVLDEYVLFCCFCCRRICCDVLDPFCWLHARVPLEKVSKKTTKTRTRTGNSSEAGGD